MVLSHSVFHFHIPKTAGTTLRMVAEDNLDGRELQDSIADREFFALSIGRGSLPQLSRFSFLSGHYPLGFRAMLKPPVLTICSIREPVELIISYFYHQQFAGLIPADISIEEFLASEAAGTVMNLQARFMANVDMPEFPAALSAYRAPIGQENTSRLIARYSQDYLYQAAMQNALTIDAVVDAGDLWPGMRALCNRLGWMIPPNLPWHNSARQPKRPPTDTVCRTIGDMCTIDTALYRTLAATINEQVPAPDLGVQICDEQHPFIIDCAMSSSGEGWHMREFDQNWGWCRWSSDSSAWYVNLRLLRKRTYSLCLLLLDCLDPARIGTVCLEMGTFRPAVRFRKDADIWRGYATLMTGDNDVQVGRITVQVPGAARLSDLGSGQDNRLLGCRVKSLMIVASEQAD